MRYGVDCFNIGNDVRIRVAGARFDVLACRVFYTKGHAARFGGVATERGFYLAITACDFSKPRMERFADDSRLVPLLLVSRYSEKAAKDALRMANVALPTIVSGICDRAGGTFDLAGAEL